MKKIDPLIGATEEYHRLRNRGMRIIIDTNDPEEVINVLDDLYQENCINDDGAVTLHMSNGDRITISENSTHGECTTCLFREAKSTDI